ncbi:Uu.00g049640.m01.CDS01 [Anthostomella pinea]|uniref:Uu.00g049640.m01.CDS01 n=1 Tax=Anthostomella pinea TaxID=933095 RepID=A0AAI8YEQ4_9PEZI|nr:Uu.00g049640.m01.CDS01 [Anthostomella pinea]
MSPHTPSATTTVLVRTTLPSTPLPPSSQRHPIRTARLLIRPLAQSDLRALFSLRSQPEFMAETRSGQIDRSIAETQAALDALLHTSDECFVFGVFVAATGHLVGDGGVHSLASGQLGWPEVGYKFRREAWRMGYATEMLGAVLGAWWALPRCRVEARVHGATVRVRGEEEGSRGKGGNGNAETGTGTQTETRERVCANVEVSNTASMRVLEKLGFERCGSWDEPDTQAHRVGKPVTLVRFTLAGPGITAGRSSIGWVILADWLEDEVEFARPALTKMAMDMAQRQTDVVQRLAWDLLRTLGWETSMWKTSMIGS